jgi:hypothetical protein
MTDLTLRWPSEMNDPPRPRDEPVPWPSERRRPKHSHFDVWIRGCQKVEVEVPHPMQLIRPDHALKTWMAIQKAIPPGATFQAVIRLHSVDLSQRFLVCYHRPADARFIQEGELPEVDDGPVVLPGPEAHWS